MHLLFFISLVFLNLFCGSLHAVNDLLFPTDMPSKIFVNNRILAQVNGKAISVVDVMKKMDMQFYKQYPQYTSSVVARFQFYQAQWKNVLQELVDKELILADAQANKVEISAGDARKEMEAHFGPNIILNLDKVGLTFDEAMKMVQDDLILKRMINARANSKALKRVTPQVIKTAYEEYAAQNSRAEQWDYQVITIRAGNQTQGSEVAQYCHQYLIDNGSLSDLVKTVEGHFTYEPKPKITISDLLHHETKEINADYLKALQELQEGQYSQALAQKSRKDNSKVFRIFFLKSHTPAGAIPMREVYNTIQDELLNMAAGEEANAYINKLRSHYHVEENLSEMTADDFAPFVLK